MTHQANIGKLRLAGFVIVSACVHAMVLSIHDTHRRLELGNARQDFISVQIQGGPAPKTHVPVHHKSHVKPSRVSPNIAKSHGDEPVKQNQPLVTKASGAKPQIHRQAIMGRLHQDIARFFFYPPQAVRRGWQGTAMIHLRLLPNGGIDSISLSSSSGHAILDRAAMDSVRKVRRLAMSNLNLRGPLEIQLPVIYRLTGG